MGSKLISAISSQFSSKEAEWEIFSSLEGRFSVLFPGKPIEENRHRDVEGNILNMYGFLGREKGIEYGVAYIDYPATIVQEKGPEAILKDASEGGLETIRGKDRRVKLNRDNISIDGHPGIAQAIETSFYKYQSQVFLVENRLYMVIVTSPKSRFSQEKAETFFDSFEVVNRSDVSRVNP